MKLVFIITYAILLILFLVFIYKRLNDINSRNIENIGCKYLKKRNNIIFIIITVLLLLLFFSWSLIIFKLI